MEVTPVSLIGKIVRLDPLRIEDATALHSAADPHTFDYFPKRPNANTVEAFGHYVQSLLDAPDRCPFAVRLLTSEDAIGVTTYLDICPEHRGLEIGSTWYGKAYRGTMVNPECKYLLLRHAFEVLGAIRVQLKTDGRNLQSQAAIARLGAQREGVLRKQFVMPDGYVRNTVMFSIVDDEWPEIKKGLEARLDAVL